MNKYARLCDLVGYVDVKLAPNDSIAVYGFWRPRTVSLQGVAAPVSAGRYSITAQVEIDKREVDSKPIRIQVVAP